MNAFLLLTTLWFSFTSQRSPQLWSEQRTDAPDSSRFTAMQLVQGLDEPMGMGILPNNNVLIVERKGGVRLYDAELKQLKTIAHINVFSGIEDGLLGVAVDPDYAQNNWVYLYYGVGGEKWVSQLARYELKGDQLSQASKKVLLEIPTQRKYCCHSAGYLTFSKGLLYLSTGDNTNAEEIEGHNPTDERPGRELSDDQASTANSKDLRGKILRIKPEPDGTYSIPDGNLFPKDGSKGRPEIYVMGCRNPFRLSVDPKNGYVYWGDVGPDTNVPAEEGTLSYDEINQARKPGFFGYPYFLGNNEAFPKYDFATKQEGPKQDPVHPVNNSPHNTGIRELPAAQPAMIWYGKQASKRFPLVGKGGASAMAGPVYYRDQFADNKNRLPDYYDGKLLIYDWIRRWMMAVTLDKNGNYVRMEPFLSHLKLIAPMDMQFNRDGSLYILAYGTNWFANNTDAGLIRVNYSEGNRNPIADIRIDKHYGAAPMTIALSAAGSKDYDSGDQLRYSWQIGSEKRTGKEVSATINKPGVYPVTLTVTDQHGGQGLSTTTLHVGNTPSQISITTNGNRSFYWDNTRLNYQISIKDPEDKIIDPARTTTSFTYLPYGKDIASVLSGGHTVTTHLQGEKLMAASDCKACHALEKTSIGPSLKAISARYTGKTEAVDQLAQKVIKGGSGVWGNYNMSAHPDLSVQDAKEMVGYILSLNQQEAKLPMQGTLALNEHVGKGPEGAYVLVASYKDEGANGIEPITSREYIVLRNPLIQMEDNDRGNVGVVIATANTGFISYIRKIYNNSFVVFDKLDLNQISNIKYRVQSQGAGGRIEVRLDSTQGPVVSTIDISGGKVQDMKTEWKDLLAPVKSTQGLHNLFFVFTNPDAARKELFHIDWMYFEPKANP
ncbi:carbohydrate-binding protein [Spirosoma endbachense]|uniref:Carbohydrate-binding protein n=2 Tax=Spirosoma endbachense TaxID=2666025 RepID=A0A6P1WAE1_9BACT|nr:carbohydrate-binding protein [Spirosoma endbachense]